MVGDRLTGLWQCGSGGVGRSPSFMGLRQVRIQGLALGSPDSGHLSIVTNTTTCERLFSELVQIHTARHNRLKKLSIVR